MDIREYNKIRELKSLIDKLEKQIEIRESGKCFYNQKYKKEVDIKIYLIKREIAQFEF